MRQVIVTVQSVEDHQAWDLEVPVDMESRHLASLIREALQLNVGSAGQTAEYQLRADPPGRVLLPSETLAQAGAWDGAYLVFQQRDKNADFGPSDPDERLGESRGPVTGWRSLGIDLPEEAEPETEEWSPDQAGFAWKKLD